mmetsp:Transcript_11174/g.29498  ORF Transcript_11174/g.29498 Transcript_11174/m.29498 type:complete len:159 (+) Transcript_11174:64-540(+)
MQALALFFLMWFTGSPCGRGARVGSADLSASGLDGTGDELGEIGIAQSALQMASGNTSVAAQSEDDPAASQDPSGTALPNNLLGSCPKDSNGMDIDGQYCDSEQLTKCCASKCRYRTTVRQSTFGSSAPVEVPKAVPKTMCLQRDALYRNPEAKYQKK